MINMYYHKHFITLLDLISEFYFLQSDRLCKVEEYKVLIHNFAKVMGMDPSKILVNVHPRLLDGPNEQQTKNISDDILNKLNMTVQQLKEEKSNRREKVICHPSWYQPL